LTKKDKIWWGKKLVGFFSIKESYALATGHAQIIEENIWIKIWNSNLWLKVAIFLWLTAHGRILTWD